MRNSAWAIYAIVGLYGYFFWKYLDAEISLSTYILSLIVGFLLAALNRVMLDPPKSLGRKIIKGRSPSTDFYRWIITYALDFIVSVRLNLNLLEFTILWFFLTVLGVIENRSKKHQIILFIYAALIHQLYAWTIFSTKEVVLYLCFVLPLVLVVYKDHKSLQDKIDQLTEDIVMKEKLATIGTLSAGINHEIGNFLNGMVQATIALEAQANRPDGPKPEKIKILSEVISRGLEGCTKIINTLSNATRDEPIEELLLENLVLDSATILGIDNSVRCTGKGQVLGDKTRIMHILLNLIKNASQAIPTEKEKIINVKIEPYPDAIQITIEDNGPGIPQDLKNRVFDPFFTTKKQGEGTGLGLHMVRTLVAHIGGDIQLGDSEEFGGAKFTLKIPLRK